MFLGGEEYVTNLHQSKRVCKPSPVSFTSKGIQVKHHPNIEVGVYPRTSPHLFVGETFTGLRYFDKNPGAVLFKMREKYTKLKWFQAFEPSVSLGGSFQKNMSSFWIFCTARVTYSHLFVCSDELLELFRMDSKPTGNESISNSQNPFKLKKSGALFVFSI